MSATCSKCDGRGGQMEETPLEERSYSSTSSGEFNGPSWVTCRWCGGTGRLVISKVIEYERNDNQDGR